MCVVFCFTQLPRAERGIKPIPSGAVCPQWRRIWHGGVNVPNKAITVGKCQESLFQWSPSKYQSSMTARVLGYKNYQRKGSLHWIHFPNGYPPWLTFGVPQEHQRLLRETVPERKDGILSCKATTTLECENVIWRQKMEEEMVFLGR